MSGAKHHPDGTEPLRRPPRLAELLLERLLPGDVASTMVGDLSEEYAHFQRPSRGRWRAALWYWRQAAGSIVPLVAARVARRGSRRTPHGRRGRIDGVGSASGGGGWERWARDLGYAARRLLANPGFSFVAVGTLALGIGANTALFSVIDSVLLRQLPYDQPERIVRGWTHSNDGDTPFFSFTVAEYKELSRRDAVFEAVGGEFPLDFTVTGPDLEPQQVGGRMVTADFFDVFGVAPARGRMFRADEIAGGDAFVTVVSHGFWQRAMGADEHAVGRTVLLNGVAFTVTGVLPEDYRHISAGAEVFIPYTIGTSTWVSHWLELYGRLQPGVSLVRAEEELNIVIDRLAESDRFSAGYHATAQGLHEMVVGDVAATLWAVFGTVALVLLIACVNVANLSLARAAAREGEIAVRKALGASRGRIVSQLLVESALLAAVGGLVGVGVAKVGISVVLATAPASIPRLDGVTLDGTVLAFALAATGLTVLLFGVAPALSLGRFRAGGALHGRAPGGAPSFQRHRLLSYLVMAEVGLALVLLAGAGLMLETLWRLREVDVGFDDQNALVLRVLTPRSRYQTPVDVGSFYDRARAVLGGLPGVEAVGAGSDLPLAGAGAVAGLTTDARLEAGETERVTGLQRQATEGFFEAAGIPILKGRGFRTSDVLASRPVMILNATMAERLFPGEDPLGRRVLFGRDPVEENFREVVGVVGDVHYRGLRVAPDPQLYQAHSQFPRRDMFLVLRTAGDPAALLEPARAALRDLDPEMPVYDVTTLEGVSREALAGTRFSAWLFAVFAGVALFLACAGVYGVLAYSVAQRQRELGIRVALGAGHGALMRLVLGRGMIPVGAGLALGAAGSVAAGRVVEGLLYGVSRGDPTTLMLVVVLLGITAVAACYLPARRAVRMNPLGALREE